MRFSYVFQCLAVFMLLASPAFADSLGLGSLGKLIWGPPNHNESRPYLNEAKIPHNSQWADDEWSPQDWIETRGSPKAVIDGFYATGVVTDQYFDEDVPVLEVGDRFMDLSPQDMHRVTAFFDHAYGVTSDAEAGVFMIFNHREDDPVGLFNKDGLQLQ